ncbi:MAG: hypothetical protein AB7O66_24335, partial [Limisphaerales bacterium]
MAARIDAVAAAADANPRASGPSGVAAQVVDAETIAGTGRERDRFGEFEQEPAGVADLDRLRGSGSQNVDELTVGGVDRLGDADAILGWAQRATLVGGLEDETDPVERIKASRELQPEA